MTGGGRVWGCLCMAIKRWGHFPYGENAAFQKSPTKVWRDAGDTSSNSNFLWFLIFHKGFPACFVQEWQADVPSWGLVYCIRLSTGGTERLLNQPWHLILTHSLHFTCKRVLQRASRNSHVPKTYKDFFLTSLQFMLFYNHKKIFLSLRHHIFLTNRHNGCFCPHLC